MKLLDKIGIRILWNKKVKGGPMARWIPLLSVIYLVVLTGLQVFGFQEAAESVRTVGGYVQLDKQSPIAPDVLIPLLTTLFAGAGAAAKLWKLFRCFLDRLADKHIPTIPLPAADNLALTRVQTLAGFGDVGGVQTGPGATTPVSNNDLGAAIAVIKENPNGVVQGLQILLKVILALFARPKTAARLAEVR